MLNLFYKWNFLCENTILQMESMWSFLIKAEALRLGLYLYKRSVSFQAIRVFERILSVMDNGTMSSVLWQKQACLSKPHFIPGILDKPAPWGTKIAMSGFLGALCQPRSKTIKKCKLNSKKISDSACWSMRSFIISEHSL